MSSTHRADLLALFYPTGGANWRRNSNWDTNAELSRWFGVKVDAHGRVVELVLRANFLRGIIPSDLKALTAIQRVDLSKNKLDGNIPKELGALTAMEQLNLSDNNLSGSIPSELGFLTNMERLILVGNKLNGSIPVELGALTAMLELDLHGNNLTGVIPKQLGALVAVESIDLSNNELSGSIPRELGSLRRIQRLDLRRNNLSGSIPNELGALTAMQKLYLNDNKLTGKIPRGLGLLPAMERLRLHSNDLSGPFPPPSYGVDMRDWANIPEEDEISRVRAAGSKNSGDNQPVIVKLLDFIANARHIVLPVVDDVTDVLLLTETADSRGPFWWICLIVLIVADIERLYLLFTLCLTVVLLPFLWCYDAFVFLCWRNTTSYFWGRTTARFFARLNCRADAPQNTLGGRLLDSFLWVLVGSRSRCSPLWSVVGMSLDASIEEAHHAGVGFGAIDVWVDRHPFRLLGKFLFGSRFKLRGGGEGASRRAGVMIRAVGETLVVDSLFLAFSVMSGGWDDNLTGVAGISAIFSVLELVSELEYYVAEAGAVLEPVAKHEKHFALDPPQANAIV